MSKTTAYIKYDTLKKVAAKLKKLKEKLSEYKIETPTTDIKGIKIADFSEAKTHCKKLEIYNFKIHPDIRNAIGDEDYYFPLIWGQAQQITKKSSEAIPQQKEDGVSMYASDCGGLLATSYFGGYIRYNLPKLEDAIRGLSNRGCSIWEPLDRDKKKVDDLRDYLSKGKTMCEELSTAINDYNKNVDNVIKGIEAEYKNIIAIYNAYKDLEKAAKEKFEGPKGKKYNKKRIATTYAALVSAAGKKNAKKYLNEILKNVKKETKSKITSSDVISVYKKWKKNGNISGNLYSKKVVKKPAGSGGGGSETGAKVVKNKSKKKNTDKKAKNTAVASIATIAAYEKTMKKKSETISNIKIGTTNKIEQAKLNLNAKISKISNDRDAKIANIEAKRDSDIANLYDDASDKINNIDITEADAKEQINTIKENLENDINSINDNANEEIEKIKASADEQIAQANKDSQAEIEDIQKSSDKEINNITENGVHEKTKTAESFENAAKETPAAEEADTSSLDEANSNKSDSATTLENSKKDYNDNISAKEQEIVNQANNVENSTETVATEVEDAGTTEQTIVYEQESDTASNNDSGNSVNYSSYNSSDSNEATSAATNVGSSVDTAVSDVESEVVETPAVPDDTSEATLIPDNPNNEETAEISSSNSSSEILDTPKKESKSSNIAIPIGLGIAATGAAAVAGVRFVKNRKQNEDVDETYDDENNDIDDYESGSDDSEYMKDDYLGPAGSMYTDTDLPEDNELSEIPDDTQYTDAGQLEEELEDDDFSEDEVLNDLG